MDADRNLLFAVLALQVGLIDRDRFVQACTLWLTRQGVPLVDVLQEQGWLTPADRAVVEHLMALRLRGGNARAGLAAAAGPQTRSAVATVLDQAAPATPPGPDPLVFLRELSDEWKLTAPGGPADGDPFPAEPSPGAAGRNLLYEEIGRGGMGRVLRGRDPDLGRELAVKVLREDYGGDAGLERRFVEEAQVGGQLQHPGVVPVYELGRLPDRRPFFTMKLVKGRTLADLLKERPDPGHEQARFVAIFEQVCQTVAYAHSKRVIHRDLKPANVMVGSFGEVQVMDWGLAKVLPAGDPEMPAEAAAGSLIRTVRSGSTAPQGETGVVGTPAYMPPEQARGAVGAIDERADVFGLGGILCDILTGRPPHAGPGLEDNVRRAAAGDLSDALGRLTGCGADPVLVALCRDCLAPRPEDRPADAGAVAGRVAEYQAAVQERLRRAELERAAAQARAEEAKATAAAERKARHRAVGLAAALLLLVAGGGGGAWWAQQRRLATDTAAAGLMREAELLREQARRQPLDDSAKYGEALATARKARQLADDGGASARLRQQAADLVGELTEEVSAGDRDRELLRALLEVRGPRQGPRFQKDDRGLMIRLAEPSAEEQFQAAFRAWDPALDVDGLATEEAASRLKARPPAVVLEVIAALDEWAAERRRQGMAEEKWKRLADLALALDDSPDSKRRQLRELLARDNLRREGALGALATALRPVPVPFDPGPGEDRGRLRRLAEETDAANEPVLGLLTLVQALREAADEPRAERLLRDAVWARPREVVLRNTLGQLLEEQGRWPEAIECYEAARALRPELGANLAKALVNAGRAEQGLVFYERLMAGQPDNPALHSNHGHALARLGRYKEAEKSFRDALRLQPDIAEARYNLGCVLDAWGRYPEAEAEYGEAIRLKPDFPQAHVNLGKVLDIQGRYKEAEDACRKALRIKPEFPEAYIARNELGGALYGQGRYKEAEAEYREALRLRPDFVEAHSNLALMLLNQGRYPEAEAASRDALRFKPDYALAHINLGYALRWQGRYDDALEAVRRGDALGRKTPGWNHPSADWVRDFERILDLDRRLPSVLGGEGPGPPAEGMAFALHCGTKRFYAAAVRLYADAFAADPRFAADLAQQHRYSAACSAALAAAGQGEDAKRLPDKVALMLRRQALGWLGADLARYAKMAREDDAGARQAVRQGLAAWQQDADLASVRDPQALDLLPADERQQWHQLWQDVADLLKKVEERR